MGDLPTLGGRSRSIFPWIFRRHSHASRSRPALSRDGDRSPLLEETRRLELLQDSRHGGTLDPDHLREEFVREGQVSLPTLSRELQNPTAAPGFDAATALHATE